MRDQEERPSQRPTVVPPPGGGATRGGDPLPAEGAEIAGHRLVRLRGAGGQGVVYEAKERGTDRLVALKTLLPGATGEDVRRFEREIEVLARLDHPNIPPLFDSGVHAGRPWFTMRLVDGKTLVEHAEALQLDPRGAVELLLRACDAVAHAHGRGVIHRDLKPDNVRIDASGEPQVLDFGIAKATGRPTLTQGSGVLGTIGDSAPEQLMGDPRRIDVRADVYSLGCLLYRLLARRPPLILPEGLGDAVALVTHEDPLPPSAHSPRSDRDLDAVCLRALARDPAGRYPSVLDFARDLRRWLAREPVEARGPSRWYRVVATVRRHRWAFGLGAAAFLVLGAFTAALWVKTRQLAEESARARLEADKARAIADAFTSMIEDVDPAERETEAATASDLLDVIGRRADSSTTLDPRVQAVVLTSVGRMFMAMGNPTRGEWSASRALQILDGSATASDAERGAALQVVGLARIRLGQRDVEGVRQLREGADLIAADEGAGGVRTAEAKRQLAQGLLEASRTQDAAALARDVIAFERSRSTVSRALFDSLVLGGDVELASGNAQGALALANDAHDIAARTFRAGDPSRHRPEALRGRALLALGRDDEALEALDAAIAGLVPGWGIEHPATQRAVFEAARACANMKRHDEAARRLQDLLELQRLYPGSHHVLTQEVRELLAHELEAAGRHDEAARVAEEAARVARALDLARRAGGP